MDCLDLFIEVHLPLKMHSQDPLDRRVGCLTGVEKIEISGIEEDKYQIALMIVPQIFQFNTLQDALAEYKIKLLSINVHFPNAVTSITDPYSASAVSLIIEKKFSEIRGIKGSSISPSGIVKIEIETNHNEKVDEIINDALNVIKSLGK